MVAYSYQQQFVEPTWSGRKQHTIRANRTGRSRHARPGEVLQHYVGMRTKSCRLFARSVCSEVLPIRLTFSSFGSKPLVTIGDRPSLTDRRDLNKFAQSDGFDDWNTLVSFWLRHHGLTLKSFDGTIIYWKDMEPVR